MRYFFVFFKHYERLNFLEGKKTVYFFSLKYGRGACLRDSQKRGSDLSLQLSEVLEAFQWIFPRFRQRYHVYVLG